MPALCEEGSSSLTLAQHRAPVPAAELGSAQCPAQHTGFSVSICWEQPGTLWHCQPSPTLQTGTTAIYSGFAVCLFCISCWEKNKIPPFDPIKGLISPAT